MADVQGNFNIDENFESEIEYERRKRNGKRKQNIMIGLGVSAIIVIIIVLIFLFMTDLGKSYLANSNNSLNNNSLNNNSLTNNSLTNNSRTNNSLNNNNVEITPEIADMLNKLNASEPITPDILMNGENSSILGSTKPGSLTHIPYVYLNSSGNPYKPGTYIDLSDPNGSGQMRIKPPNYYPDITNKCTPRLLANANMLDALNKIGFNASKVGVCDGEFFYNKVPLLLSTHLGFPHTKSGRTRSDNFPCYGQSPSCASRVVYDHPKLFPNLTIDPYQENNIGSVHIQAAVLKHIVDNGSINPWVGR